MGTLQNLGITSLFSRKSVTQKRGKSPFVALRCHRICMQLASGPRICSIKLDRKGRRLLASCSDRVLRVAEVAAPSEQQRQQAIPAEQASSCARIVSRVSLLSTQLKACAYAASIDNNTAHWPGIQSAFKTCVTQSGRLLCSDDSGQCVQDKGADKAGLIALSRQEFQAGTVERSTWQAAAFSFDSEHVAGATAGHKIYAWSLHSGILGRFLEFEGKAPLGSPA